MICEASEQVSLQPNDIPYMVYDFHFPVPSTPASTTPGSTRTTSEGEILTTTTPGEVCEKVLGMDDPQLVPDRFIEVSRALFCSRNHTWLTKCVWTGPDSFF